MYVYEYIVVNISQIFRLYIVCVDWRSEGMLLYFPSVYLHGSFPFVSRFD